MAIVCDFCPHEVDGEFSLAQAELSTMAICVASTALTHPTIDKSSCDDHFDDMILETLVGKEPGR